MASPRAKVKAHRAPVIMLSIRIIILEQFTDLFAHGWGVIPRQLELPAKGQGKTGIYASTRSSRLNPSAPGRPHGRFASGHVH